jgi:hypothetical protein
MPSDSPSFTQDDILAQVYMAFGQGTATMLATPAALRAGRTEYVKTFEPENWLTDAPVALEYARALGRVAAHLAVQKGATAIDEEHFMRAAEMVRGNQVWPCFCPYCPPVSRWRPASNPPAGGGPIR